MARGYDNQRAKARQMPTQRILLVDDEHSIREGLGKVLSAENYEVVLAENGQQAVSKQGAERIDLLLLDLHLPAKDGWAVLKWVAEVNPSLPVILITGRPNQRRLAEQAGADALMEKPLDVPLLLQTIRELLDEPVAARALRASKRGPGFRFGPCDNQLFREMLLSRSTTPYPCPAAQEPCALTLSAAVKIEASARQSVSALIAPIAIDMTVAARTVGGQA
jgi:CheY-like chemotaxis protein